MTKKIIILAPHPDDEYFIAECLFNSFDITICLVTKGDSNFDSENKGCDYRLNESMNYARMIGAEVINLNISCNKLTFNLLYERLSAIDFSQFDIVCLVDPYDWHPDHRLITKCMIKYLGGVRFKGDLIFYEVTSRGLDMRLNVMQIHVKYDYNHILRRNCFKSQLNLLKREDFRRLKGLNLQYRYAITNVFESIELIDFDRHGSYEEVILSLSSDII